MINYQTAILASVDNLGVLHQESLHLGQITRKNLVGQTRAAGCLTIMTQNLDRPQIRRIDSSSESHMIPLNT
jgi:hypothetical protein